MPPAEKTRGPCKVAALGCLGSVASANSEHADGDREGKYRNWRWRKADLPGSLKSDHKRFGMCETSWEVGDDVCEACKPLATKPPQRGAKAAKAAAAVLAGAAAVAAGGGAAAPSAATTAAGAAAVASTSTAYDELTLLVPESIIGFALRRPSDGTDDIDHAVELDESQYEPEFLVCGQFSTDILNIYRRPPPPEVWSTEWVEEGTLLRHHIGDAAEPEEMSDGEFEEGVQQLRVQAQAFTQRMSAAITAFNARLNVRLEERIAAAKALCVSNMAPAPAPAAAPSPRASSHISSRHNSPAVSASMASASTRKRPAESMGHG